MTRIALLAVFLCGCAHNVIDMGAGRYSITDASVNGSGKAREGAANSAAEFCTARGEKAVIESFDDKRNESSVVFHCEKQ